MVLRAADPTAGVARPGSAAQSAALCEKGLAALVAELGVAAESLARWTAFVGARLRAGLFGGAGASELTDAQTEERSEAAVEALERSGFQHLRLLASVMDGAGAGNARDFVAGSTLALRTVLQLTSVGSPRIQRLAFRLLRRVLPVASPTRFAEIASTGSRVPGASTGARAVAGAALVLYLLRRAGQENCALLARGSSLRTPRRGDWFERLGPHGFVHGYGAGHAFLGSAAEAVMLVRAMLRMRPHGWADVAHRTAEAAILAGSARLTHGGNVHDGVVAACSGALSALGSHVPTLRVGAVAEIASRASSVGRESNLVRALLGGQSRGIVVAYARGYAKALVLFGTDATPSAVLVEEVRVVNEIGPPAASMSLASAVLRAIAKIATLASASVVAPGGGGNEARSSSPLLQQGGSAGASEASETASHGAMQLSPHLVAAMRACAYRALPHILQNEHSAVAAAEMGILDALVERALEPSATQSFVAAPYLEERSTVLFERLFEVDHYFSRATPSDAALPNAQGGRSGDGASGHAGGIGAAARGGVQRRLDLAQRLSGVVGRSVALCLKALALNNESMDDAAEWIMVHSEAFVAGGGMESVDDSVSSVGAGGSSSGGSGAGAGDDVSASADVDISTWQVAKQLGIAAGLPPMLCYRALELCHNDSNRAMGWLLDQGEGYVKTMSELRSASGDAFFASSLRGGGRESGADHPLGFGAPPDASDAPHARGPMGLLLKEDEALIDHVGPLAGSDAADEGWDQRQAEERARRQVADSQNELTPEATSRPHDFGCVARRIAFGGARGRAEFIFRGIDTGGGVQHMISSLRPGTLLTKTRVVGPAPRVVGRFTGHITWRGVRSAPGEGLPRFDVRVVSQRSGVSRCYAVADATECRLHTQVGGASGAEVPCDALPRLAIATFAALITRAAREAILALSGRALVRLHTRATDAAPLSPSEAFARLLGGSRRLLKLLKLVAASEHAFSNAFAPVGGDGSGGIEGEGAEESDGLQPRVLLTPLLEARVAALLGSVGRNGANALEESSAFRALIVRECTEHLTESTKPGDASEHKVVESLHPYFPCCEYAGEVHFEGAKALRIELDTRCSLDPTKIEFRGDNVPVARLDFFESTVAARSGVGEEDGGGAANGVRVKSFVGRTFAPASFVVHGSCVRYNFFAHHPRHRNPMRGRDTMTERYGWGYRFRVSPIRGLQWLREVQVFREPSLVWACWLMGFVLRDASSRRSGRDLAALVDEVGAAAATSPLSRVAAAAEEDEVAWTLPSTDDSAAAAEAAAEAEAEADAEAERTRLALTRAAPLECDRSASALHNRRIVNALLRYMYSTDAPFKHRVVALLAQLLTAPHLFVGSLPSHRPLVVLRKVVAFRLQAEADGGGVFVPLRLQHVAELAAVAENFARFHLLEGREPLFRATVQQRATTKRAKKVKVSFSLPLQFTRIMLTI
jgi:hypothetical protein